MCLILFSLGQSDDLPLVVIANRDEFYARPTRAAHWWEDHPDTFGGRDQQAQGTWMGVNRQGRFAAVTNVREPGSKQPASRSRGDLTREFLTGSESPQSFLERIEVRQEDFAGFNLLIGDRENLLAFSNRQPGVRKLSPGIYGISNGYFDESWPKLSSGKIALEQGLEQKVDDRSLIQIMESEQTAIDALLPSTGVSLEKERFLSSRFIKSPDYGTRTTSLVKFSNKNAISFTEQSFDPETGNKTFVHEEFRTEPSLAE